ncbi:MAG: hypothetical protein ACJ786_19695 [Catenulispora sp.]
MFCTALVALQITIVTLVPAHLRAITAGLLMMMTIAAVIVVAMEVSFKRAAVRAAEATARLTDRPRQPRGQVSPLIQQAYDLARSDASAAYIARNCEIPHAFATLIVDDVRRTASRKGRAPRNSSGRPHSGSPRPKNPPAI